jgi:hypothetical protein
MQRAVCLISRVCNLHLIDTPFGSRQRRGHSWISFRGTAKRWEQVDVNFLSDKERKKLSVEVIWPSFLILC